MCHATYVSKAYLDVVLIIIKKNLHNNTEEKKSN